MTDFTRYQDVVLLRDIPEQGLCAGDVGTIVERHDVPGREAGYSVEFFDMLGNTVAVVTLSASAWRAPTSVDRPAVRVQLAPTSAREFMRTLPSQSSFPPIPSHPSITFTLDRVEHVEAVLILPYLTSAPVLMTVFTAFRGPVISCCFSSITPQ